MKVFLAEIKDISQHINPSTITTRFNCPKRNLEYSLGRFIVKCAANKIYGIDNVIIDETEKKPIIRNAEIDFSISHSGNIAGVAFNKSKVGLDIEKVKQRNLSKLSKRYNKEFENLDEFYEYWTKYEASYKSGNSCAVTFKYNDYVISVSSKNLEEIEFYTVKILSDTQDLNNINFENIDIKKLVF